MVKASVMSPNGCTTKQAAKRVGITRATLQDWIKKRKVVAPRPTLRGAVAVRLWTREDIDRLRAVKKKIYWKGRGGTPKKKQ
jgi:excisionase family DNA binding protein